MIFPNPVLGGHVSDGAVTSALGSHRTQSALSGDVAVVIRPEQLEVASADLPCVAAVVSHRKFYGHDALLRLALASATARTAGHPLPEVGERAGWAYAVR